MLSGNSLRQTARTRCASVHQAAKLVAALLRVVGVTAGWLPRTGISSRTLCVVIEYWLPLPFFSWILPALFVGMVCVAGWAFWRDGQHFSCATGWYAVHTLYWCFPIDVCWIFFARLTTNAYTNSEYVWFIHLYVVNYPSSFLLCWRSSTFFYSCCSFMENVYYVWPICPLMLLWCHYIATQSPIGGVVFGSGGGEYQSLCNSLLDLDWSRSVSTDTPVFYP